MNKHSIQDQLVLIWLSSAELVGALISRIFLGLVFFAIVVPVGTLKRLCEGDQRYYVLRHDKKSAFNDRDHRVGPDDFIKPY